MATITFDAQNAKDNQTIDAIAALYNYQTQITDQNGQLIPNPENKTQFARRHTKKWFREIRKAYVVNLAADTARATALGDFNNNDPEE